MDVSFWIGAGHPWPEIRRTAEHMDRAGWHGLWVADHFMPFADERIEEPMHEVWSVLSGLAVATDRVRLGPLVCGNTYRNPAVLMKQAVTTDHLSDGRVVLGIGAGWQENEHTAYGITFGTFTDRFQWLEEALIAMRSLRSETRTSLDGSRYTMVDAPLAPKPIGPLPIMIGGGGEKKTLRLVATYAEEWNVWADNEIMAHKSGVLDGHCEAVGRDPAEVRRSAVALLFLCDSEERAAALRERPPARPSLIGTPEQLVEQMAAFEAMGVDEVIIPDFNLGDEAERIETADRFMAEVVSAL
ncbi:MAG: TIGR03560 family F420-dependent LLM class oxidoreductase [Actinomycetota bacterium]